MATGGVYYVLGNGLWPFNPLFLIQSNDRTWKKGNYKHRTIGFDSVYTEVSQHNLRNPKTPPQRTLEPENSTNPKARMFPSVQVISGLSFEVTLVNGVVNKQKTGKEITHEDTLSNTMLLSAIFSNNWFLDTTILQLKGSAGEAALHHPHLVFFLHSHFLSFFHFPYIKIRWQHSFTSL